MRYTSRETEQATTTRLIRAWDRRRPITITYIKADGTETIRTIEIYDITVTKAGNVILKAMDRESGESRTWRLDRIVAYTVHAGTYQVQREQDVMPRPLAAAPVVATPLTAAPWPVRLQQLADTLAA